MKVAVITDEFDADVEHAVAVMAQYQVRGVELRQMWDKNIVDAPREYWDRAKAALDRHGMEVVGIASPFYKCELPGENGDGPRGPLHSARVRGLDEQRHVLDRAFEAARFFGTRLVRVFSFWRRGPLTAEIEQQIVDAYAEPARLAAEAGIVLGLENEHACYTGTGTQTARVLEKIGSPFVRAIWDPGNAFCDGEQPYPHGYEAIREFVVHIHVKDAATASPGQMPAWTVVGEGDIDYRGQVRALKNSGYTGYLSLEAHYRGRATQEASTRACLEGLIRLVESA
ncbi:MAG: sugar phosphate isomerase/epimerase family protein [Capsulimonadaceae bacterium]